MCARLHEKKNKIAYLKHVRAQTYQARQNFIKSWNYFHIIFFSRSRLLQKCSKCIRKSVNI